MYKLIVSSSDDSENKSEEAEVWNDPAVVVSNVDDKETEHGLLASFGTQPDTHTYTEEFSSSDFKLNTSKCKYVILIVSLEMLIKYVYRTLLFHLNTNVMKFTKIPTILLLIM